MLLRAVGVVAGVLTDAVERGDVVVGDERGREGGGGGDGVVGTNVENLKPFILLD